MTGMPDEKTVAIWVDLTRVQRLATAAVERRLKDAGLPPLAWYDALWELEKAGSTGLRPFELERALLFEQYNLSRLIDRLEKAGLVERHTCPDDRRGRTIRIARAGAALRRRMWKVYGPALNDAVGDRLTASQKKTLSALLKALE